MRIVKRRFRLRRIRAEVVRFPNCFKIHVSWKILLNQGTQNMEEEVAKIIEEMDGSDDDKPHEML